ncbi:hypothetical protein FRC12_004305 [Ceratobasidium sp. 428]|nr:hypothetical protein FRC12_004305 [Ceratobasidium sp. 428]
MTYGYNIEDHEDYFLKLAEETMAMFALVTTPGMFLVDTFPWLKYIPWTSFGAKALVWRQLLAKFREQPMEYTRKQMASESFEPCLAAKWIECLEDEPNPSERRRNESMIKWAGVALYGGGADTTVSAISTFFIAMIYYPKVQAIAQAEIDRVIGQDRLPTYSDRSSLPYIEALYKEVLRWRPVGPLGVPHCLDPDKDDVYRGKFQRLTNQSPLIDVRPGC